MGEVLVQRARARDSTSSWSGRSGGDQAITLIFRNAALCDSGAILTAIPTHEAAQATSFFGCRSGAEKPGSYSVRNIETEATFAIEEGSRRKSIDATSLPHRNLRWRSSHLHRQRLSCHTVCSGFDGGLDYAPKSKRRKE
jgi:hypothetical protein